MRNGANVRKKPGPAAGVRASEALHDEVRPLAEPVDPVEVVESIPEEVEAAADVLRQSAELTFEQARSSYDQMRVAAEEATSNIGSAVVAASSGMTELNLKALDALKNSTDAAFDFVHALAGARTLSDVVSIQSEHMRKQLEMANAQTREFAELAGKVSARAMAPLSETINKSFGSPT
jgi:phasin